MNQSLQVLQMSVFDLQQFLYDSFYENPIIELEDVYDEDYDSEKYSPYIKIR